MDTLGSLVWLSHLLAVFHEVERHLAVAMEDPPVDAVKVSSCETELHVLGEADLLGILEMAKEHLRTGVWLASHEVVVHLDHSFLACADDELVVRADHEVSASHLG